MTIEPSSIKWCFRPSSTKDLDRLYEIWHASVIATHDFLKRSDLDDICVQVKNGYLPKRPLLVAVDSQGTLVGFMGVKGHEIESLFLDPKWRRRGLGRAFIEEVSAQSPYLDVVVNVQNHQAVTFYEVMGFATYASSPTDEEGRPYPILRMRRTRVTLH